MKFWLGVGRVAWLERHGLPPLMISRRTLAERRRTLPRAAAPWVLDSGAFTELSIHHHWPLSAAQYAAVVRRYADEIGQLEWAAPQDWMCEPHMVAGTGLTVAEHIRRTVANYVELRTLAPDLPIIPVLQGWALEEYLACAAAYAAAGVDLATQPVVGVGSVCRRGTAEQVNAERIVRHLAAHVAPHLHGFGVSIVGLQRYADALYSADSHAWSFDRRRAKAHMPACTRPPSPRGDDYAPHHCPGCAAAWAEWARTGGARPTLFTK